MRKNFPNTSQGHCDAHHPVIAAIDLGTNSCRLLVATVNVAGLMKSPYRTRHNTNAWKVIDSFGKIVRLGEGLHSNDTLSPEAIDRSIEALTICKRKIEQHNVDYLRVVATEACRRATNANVLADRAKNELGLSIEIISTEEEARLALTGCAGVMSPKIPYAVMFDIGGGSTEIIWIKIKEDGKRRPGYPLPFEVLDSLSIPYGVVTLSEQYAEVDSIKDIYAQIQEKIKEHLAEFVLRNGINDLIQENQVQLLGSSGTVTTLAAVKLGLSKYERRYVDGIEIDVPSMLEVIHSIINMNHEERMKNPCIGGGREDLVVVGSAILGGILSVFAIPNIRVADRGVREGILAELLTHINRDSIYKRQ